jgi:vacuolar-type H+-ATPase subunit H
MIFLGREISEQRDYSEAVAQVIDEEVKQIVDEAHQKARQILTERRDKLEMVAQRLIEVETIDYEEFLELMGEPASNKRKRLELQSKQALPSPQEQSESDQGNERPKIGGALPTPA